MANEKTLEALWRASLQHLVLALGVFSHIKQWDIVIIIIVFISSIC